ncbi:MAG: GNAT family N-acetyltransferase [Eubacteriales bacterium]
MEFILLNEDDLPSVLSFLKNSAIWLREKEIDYWQNWHDPPKPHVNWVQEGLRMQQFYLVRKDNKDIGIFRLQYEDERFWGKRDDNAGYIHSFTVSRELSGQGWGYRILAAIETLLKHNGYEYMRLDCSTQIEGLKNYYKKFGFKETGSAVVGGEDVTLMEKKII